MEQRCAAPLDNESIAINHQLHLLANSVNSFRQTSDQLVNCKQLHFCDNGNISAMAHQLLREIAELLQIVRTNRLDRWQNCQKLSSLQEVDSNKHLDVQLDEIQEWFNCFAGLLAMVRDQCIQLCQVDVPNMQQCVDEVAAVFGMLVESAVVIDRQPPQVQKTHLRFKMNVRMLLTQSREFGLLGTGEVRVDIVNEAQARLLPTNTFTATYTTSGHISHNTGRIIELSHTPDKLCCLFNNLQLRSIKRSERSAKESVTDDKFALLITVRFDGEMPVPTVVRKLSLPLVVTVHGSQASHAWATILWDNAFAHPQRIPFEISCSGRWSQLAETLNAHFQVHTGRALNSAQLQFVGEKLLGTEHDSADSRVSWSRFCKAPMAGCNFSFWDWFYAVIKLIREKLLTPWMDNRVVGFVSRHQTKEMLSQCEPGTFLLRFQESVIGNLSIAVVDRSQQVSMIELTPTEFAIYSLSEIIGKLEQCVYLYPDIPKSQAFHFSQVVRMPNRGYVRPQVRLTVNDRDLEDILVELNAIFSIHSPIS